MKINDEDIYLLLLKSLPIYFQHFKDAFFYGKEYTITFNEVHKAMRLKELSKMKDLKINDNGEGLSISRGSSESKGNQKWKRAKSESKSKSKVFMS